MLRHLTVERVQGFIRQDGQHPNPQLRQAIDGLSAEEKEELLALMYLGRDDFHWSFERCLEEARAGLPDKGLGGYMTGKPLAKYLTNGLATLQRASNS